MLKALPDSPADGEIAISLHVNGKRYSASVPPRLLLADFLRHRLGLTGTHIGCEQGVCGACTIVLNGDTVRSCLTFAVQANEASITTVEGLSEQGGPLTSVQQAFHDCHALQCGYCTPGFLIVITDFLERVHCPTDAQIIDALSANLCRCTGYVNMIAAVRKAALDLQTSRAAAGNMAQT